MEPTHVSEPTNERPPLRLIASQADPCDDEMSVQDQILSSWYMVGTTASGLGVPTELEFWRYAA